MQRHSQAPDLGNRRHKDEHVDEHVRDGRGVEHGQVLITVLVMFRSAVQRQADLLHGKALEEGRKEEGNAPADDNPDKDLDHEIEMVTTEDASVEPNNGELGEDE